MQWIFKSERLGFRHITQEDAPALSAFLQDIDVMYAWEHAFSDDEVAQWIQKNLHRYTRDGFSYFAAVEKDTGKLIGAMGPLVEEAGPETHIGIAYILNKAYWHKGFAREGAEACVQYAFTTLHVPRITAQIRPDNRASRRVAEHLGMRVIGKFVKHYNGKDMPHLLYGRDNPLEKDR